MHVLVPFPRPLLQHMREAGGVKSLKAAQQSTVPSAKSKPTDGFFKRDAFVVFFSLEVAAELFY